MKKHDQLLKNVLAALFLALAMVLPFLTGQIPNIGSMLCPMHVPILLCGFICGGVRGFAVGATAPLLRSLIFSMPPLFPTALCMAFELAAYGAAAGVLYKIFAKKKRYIYLTLIISMIIGRLVWGAAMLVCMGVSGGGFTASAFVSGAIINALPGIALQIILVPVLVMVYGKTQRKQNNA